MGEQSSAPSAKVFQASENQLEVHIAVDSVNESENVYNDKCVNEEMNDRQMYIK